ncbi:MAG: SAM-dependent methyltransferase [Lachnospira sp.]|nr:SAM-dependent methyltransferase [Lachnospira sp.]
MKDYKLSDRLLLVADWVKPKSVVADIGTDHAYLPIYLALQDICSKAIALDVRKKPLERAKENIAQFDVLDRVEIRLSDGMDELLPMEADVVTICGMGGKLMMDILRRGRKKVNHTTQLLLSPQSDLRLFRIFLYENGIQIIRENMIKEDNQYYVLMDCRWNTVEKKQKTVNFQSYSDMEEMNFRYGEYLLNSKNGILKELLEHDKTVYLGVLKRVTEAHHLKNADMVKVELRIRQLHRDIKIIDMALDKF